MTKEAKVIAAAFTETGDEVAALGAMLEFIRARVEPMDAFAAYLVGMAADYLSEMEQLPDAHKRN